MNISKIKCIFRMHPNISLLMAQEKVLSLSCHVVVICCQMCCPVVVM